ncbi:MAG: hypothetical protein D6731_17045 [Planctomycetota bacterium]|nr:MAG: hypothetical protein D6731_17045 [Planctomycetota bacterium]
MLRVLTLAMVFFCVALTPVLGKDRPTKKGPKAEQKAEKPDVIVVDVNGKLQLTSYSKLKEFKKKLMEDYKRAVKEYSAAKKKARKNKEAFDEPKPKKPKVKVLSRRPLSQADAEALLAKIEEERRKAKARKARKGRKKGKQDEEAGEDTGVPPQGDDPEDSDEEPAGDR